MIIKLFASWMIFNFIYLNVFAIESNDLGQKKVCVVSFLEANHIYNDLIDQSLNDENKTNVLFIKEAKPNDLIKCLKANVTEISIVAHSVLMQENENWMNLYYFDRGEPRPISDEIFIHFFDQLKLQKPKSLKQMRFIFCESEKILSRYNLRKRLTEFGVKILTPDFSILAGILSGFRDVSLLDHRWLAESFQNSSHENIKPTNEKIYFYIHTNTVLLYQYGNREVLRGQYNVVLNGAALGLEEKWRMFWIPREDLNNIAVGETKTFWIPTFGFSIDLASLTFEIQGQGEDQVQFPNSVSDTNGFGTSLGLFAHVEITRKY